MPRTTTAPEPKIATIKKPARAGERPRSTDEQCARIVRAFVNDSLPLELIDLIEQSSHGWDRVLRAFGYDDARAVDELCAMEEQLKAALPSDELRDVLLRYSESFNNEVSVAQDAAFAVGIEIGRRMAAGGVR